MNTKGKVALGLLGGAAVIGTIAAVASKSEASSGSPSFAMQILDANGNPVPRSPAPRYRRGVALSSTSYNLVPGNYSVRITVTNTSTNNGVPWPVSLTITLSSTISGIITPVSDTEAFTASQQRVFNYPFIVTNSLLGQTGTFSAALLDPNSNVLQSDSANVSCGWPAMIPGALTATKFYDNGNTSGVAPGTALPILMGQKFWADLNFTYQYQGGNYTFLAELNMGGGVYLRSYKDMVLPNAATATTVPVTTQNQDVFAVNGVAFGTPIDVRLSLIYRGQGSDYSQWTSVLTNTYTGAYIQGTPDYAPSITQATVLVPSPNGTETTIPPAGLSINYNSSYLLRFYFMLEAFSINLGDVNISVVITKPDNTTGNMTSYGKSYGKSGYVYTGYVALLPDSSSTPFNQYGKWTFVATFILAGVTIGQYTATINVPTNIVYGGTITIG